MKKLTALALAAFTSAAPAHAADPFELKYFGEKQNLHSTFDLVAFCEQNRPTTVLVIQLGPGGTQRALEDGIRHKDTPVKYNKQNFHSYGLIVDENNGIHDVKTHEGQVKTLEGLKNGTLKQMIDINNLDQANLYRYMLKKCEPGLM